MNTFLDKKSLIALELFKRVLRIRLIEEEIANRYSEGKMRCPMHLSIGQEAVAAGVGLALRDSDYAISTHRAHAHYLGKGGNLKAMIAEIYGKVTGCSYGRGGSMHLIDLAVGFQGSTAIVANSIPIGVGFALSMQLKKSDQLSCIFVGDGAVEEGVFYEAANFAAVKKLPVLFICENNLYSVYSPLSVRQPTGRKIYEMVRAIGIKSEHIDGNNAISVFEATQRAANLVRGGEPYFLEFPTYRWREHCGQNYDNHIGYRDEAEFNEWKLRDPLLNIRTYLLKNNLINDAINQKITDQITQEIEEAFSFAEMSQYPKAEDAFLHVYKE